MVKHSETDLKNIEKVLEKERIRVYFIGIGGIGMSALARLCLERGYAVFGSDRQSSDITESLARSGADIKYVSEGENITLVRPDIVVYTLSIEEDNAEYLAAKSHNIPTVSRAEFLGVVMRGYKKRIGVSGSHGKSTVTAMLVSILSEAGLEPSAISGAPFSSGSSYVGGGDSHLVYEACEYGDSFLKFSPTVEILLNLDFDHADYFKDADALKRSFTAAANLAKKAVVLNADSENLSEIIDSITVPVHTYSSKLGSTYRYSLHHMGEGRYGFDLFKHEKFLGSFSLGIMGKFNAENAVAAAVGADVLGVSAEVSGRALSAFGGICRRLEKIGSLGNIPVFYDYAHHPREIRAIHEALTDAGYKKISTVFRPHTYTRTKAFFDEFAKALSLFSLSLITEIFPAREKPIEGVTSSALAARACGMGARASICSEDSALEFINEENTDCLVLMGAGNLDAIKERIKGRYPR